MRVVTPWGAILAYLSVLGLSSCSPSISDPSPLFSDPARATYLISLDSRIASAIEDGASQAQLDLLESTRDDGFLSFSVAHEALTNYASCLTDHGVGFREVGTTGPPEFPMYDYRVTTQSTENMEWMDRCDLLEFRQIDGLYQTQPRFGQVRKDQVDAHREEILSCLSGAGRPLPENATVDEITHELFYVFLGKYIDSPDEPSADFQPVDCLSPTGIDWNDLVIDTRSPGFS